ncbi:hypothetical protein G7Y79_00025g057720 [Physcia stellaris]|nr:hypothetical protein G7Y79_00025g057720 [Physcia stellaris]
MSRNARPLATLSNEGYALAFNVAALRNALSRGDRPVLANLYGDHAVLLAFPGRISADITHPQELKALAIQIAGRPASQRCTRCAQAGEDKPEFVFPVCRQAKGEPGACGECWFRHKASQCSLNPMRVESAAAGVMPSASVNTIVPPLHQRGTRAYIRSVGAPLMSTSQCPPQRSPNKRRRLASPVERERSEEGDEADEPTGSRAEVAADPSLFLPQDEESPQPEQHDNYGGFDSHIEVGRRASESPDVFSTTERVEASDSQTPGVDRDRAPTLRPRVVEGPLSPSWFYPRRRRGQRTYGTKKRLHLVL